MGQIVVNVGSFDLTSHNGNTAYSSVRYFDIPANAGITGCTATFAQHVNTGNFQGKSFSLNGAQAHPNTPWPTSGISLNVSLLSTGQNTFRAAVKSQAGLSARWSIGDIYLTIDYNDVGGGGGGYDPGVISLNKASLTAGESLAVSITGASGGVYRDVYIQKMPSTANIKSIAQGHGSGAGSWTVTIPESWCETLSPNDPSFEVRIYMVAYIAGGAVVGDGAKMLTVNVPASAVPTIGSFTATRDANGVDGSITNYVQNYSKVNLAMGSVAGALGSGIASYEITGGGFSAAAASEAFGPFAQTGDITFTAKVTDTRGRTATRAVSINVLSYGPAAFSNPEAYRSAVDGVKNGKGTYARLKSGVSYSSLDGQNSVTLKGRVYPKGGAVPAYTSMTPDTEWITGGGLLLVTKTYIAQMEVADLIGSRVIEFTIPTKKTGISIMAGMQGIAFGKSAEIPGVAEFGWPIYNCPYEVGDILQTLNTSSPEDRWPGTEWESIAGRVLVGLDSAQTEFDTIGKEGGEKTHTLTQAELPDIPANPSVPTICSTPNNTGGPIVDYHILGSQTTSGYSVPGIGADLGSGEAHNNLQPYKVVYMWLRTA
jgi:hypothetical protein